MILTLPRVLLFLTVVVTFIVLRTLSFVAWWLT